MHTKLLPWFVFFSLRHDFKCKHFIWGMILRNCVKEVKEEKTEFSNKRRVTKLLCATWADPTGELWETVRNMPQNHLIQEILGTLVFTQTFTFAASWLGLHPGALTPQPFWLSPCLGWACPHSWKIHQKLTAFCTKQPSAWRGSY